MLYFYTALTILYFFINLGVGYLFVGLFRIGDILVRDYVLLLKNGSCFLWVLTCYYSRLFIWIAYDWINAGTAVMLSYLHIFNSFITF